MEEDISEKPEGDERGSKLVGDVTDDQGAEDSGAGDRSEFGGAS